MRQKTRGTGHRSSRGSSTNKEGNIGHPAVSAPSAHWTARCLQRQASCCWQTLLLALLLSPLAVLAQIENEGSITSNSMQSGSLLLRMRSGYVVATRINTEIGINVSGMVARVAVRQAFRNDGPDWVEGVYVFPLPDGAAVDHMRMRIGERIIEGEIREKEKARKAYEQAKASGRKASLVEKQRGNLFTSSVANIGPGETVTIEVEYLETVRFDDGRFSLRFPLTLTPRFIPGTPQPGRRGSGWSADTDRVWDASLITPPVVSASTDHKVTLHASINAGVRLQHLTSRYHPVKVAEDDDTYTVTLANAAVPMDHDLELIWRPVPDASPRAMLFSEQVNQELHFLLMVLPPSDLSVPTVVMAREMVFVIDTSGSMHGTSIEQAKQSLQLALKGLRPTDRFNVIQFNSVTSYLFPASVDATSANVARAGDYVRQLEANGGTNMRPALEMALNSADHVAYLRQIIFVTDGSVGNEAELFSLIERDLGTARLFTVGIGSAPNGWFMRKSAEIGRGTYTFISALHEVNDRMAQLFRKLETPQVTDIDLLWPQGTVIESYPAVVADLYAGEPIVVKARMSSAARSGDIVQVSGDSAMGGWSQTLMLADNSVSFGVGALWARARIEALLDAERRGQDATELRDAIVATALDHHLVSKYTSLIAVDKTPVRPLSESLSKEQVPNLLPHGQSQRAIFGFPATATNAATLMMTGLVCIMLALILLVSGRQRKRWDQNRFAMLLALAGMPHGGQRNDTDPNLH